MKDQNISSKSNKNDDIIIVSNDVCFNENTELKYHIFYDYIDNIKIDIIEYEKKLFISKKLDHYGVLSVGNNIIESKTIF